jgi:aerobic-type carbon monoxide dehydrogenase small subunit (CoxS/CutS family)
MSTIQVNMSVNGLTTSIVTEASRTLLEVLRDELHLTGAKDACGGEGECGACTVLLNGVPVNSCMVMIGQMEGCEVMTIEGLSEENKPDPIQTAFIEEGAIQCGYCTPGMVMASKALLDQNPNPDDEQIRTALAGNLCRCTGYTKIIAAIHRAAKDLKNGN